MILLLGGTAETQSAVSALREAGEEVLLSTLTPWGAALDGSVETRTGPLDTRGLLELIRSRDIRGIVDVTHPYAREVTRHAREAAAEAGIVYLRYERPPVELRGEGIRRFATLEALAAGIREYTGTVFLTLGSRHLSIIRRLVPEASLVARVLPEPESLAAAREAGFSPAEIIALAPPVSRELNLALFRERKAVAVVTKESGVAGGILEKAAAARELGLPLLVWERPPTVGDEVGSIEELLSRWRDLQNGGRRPGGTR